MAGLSQAEFIHNDDDATFRHKIEESGGLILGDETVLGRKCILIEMPDLSGKSDMKTKIWYYYGIPLRMKNDYYDMEAVNIQENVSLPDEKFELPAGIRMLDLPG